MSTNTNKQFKHHQYFRPNKEKFRIKEECRNYFTDVTRLLTNIPRSYSRTIGKDVYELARDILWTTTYANSIQVGKRKRLEKQLEVVNMIDRLYDLYTPLERLGLISRAQNGEFSRKTDNLRIAYEYWLSSDLEQIRKNQIEDEAKDIRADKTCWE